MMKIGISLRVVNAQNYSEKRDALSHDWLPFFEKLNVLPVFIPNNLSNVEFFLNNMDINGFVLSGGDNLGEYPERDNTEKQIINFGIKHNLPIFGVCRGMQLINEHFGGSIIKTKDSKHVASPHTVTITNSFISSILEKTVLVNSYHNNIINSEILGDDLEPFALASNDKTVEGFFHKKFPIMGVMWHPERDPNIQNTKILSNVFLEKNFWKNII